MQKPGFLRKEHPLFIYKNYAYKVNGNNLEIVFDFLIEPDIRFKPAVIVKNINKARLKKIGDSMLDNFAFHLGLMEIPSYWKATCSPQIIIEAGYLDKEQIKWWHDLIIKGLGQFFYENKINWQKSGFLKIKCKSNKKYQRYAKFLRNRYLVPVGGGKDSIVTLEKLRKKQINAFVVNPTKAVENVLRISGIKESIVVERRIDSSLLELNKKGYLNGHTPFTAVLSFLSVFCAVLFDYKHIAFSNEKSADEGNVEYLGKTINHQYSKSSEFEKKFKSYCQRYLAKNIHYFSFLRKYTELEISKMFSKYSKYFSAFLSCNIASKTDGGWCRNCSKCLFVYVSLYPYLNEKQILQIFNEDLFKKKKLLSIMKALIGQGKAKPFECVGTYRESRLALNLSLKKARKSGKIPYLLQKFHEAQ